MYPQTLYCTPENIEEAYIYDEISMIKLIVEVKAIYGYDVTLSDCSELTLVSVEQDHAIYESSKSKHPQQVKIIKLDGEFKALWF